MSDKYIKLSDINYSLTIFVSRKSIGIHPEMLWKAVERHIPQVGKYLLPHGRADSSWACPVMPSTDCQSFKSSNKVSLELPSQGGTIKRKRCFSPTYTVANSQTIQWSLKFIQKGGEKKSLQRHPLVEGTWHCRKQPAQLVLNPSALQLSHSLTLTLVSNASIF